MAAATATKPASKKAGNDNGVDVTKVKAALKRAGISEDVKSYTDAQIKRAASAKGTQRGDNLRKFIMGSGNGSTSSRSTSSVPAWIADVRKALDSLYGENNVHVPTAKQIARVERAIKGGDNDFPSDAQMRKLAKGEKVAEATTINLRDFLKRNPTKWVSARKLAGIVVALRKCDRI